MKETNKDIDFVKLKKEENYYSEIIYSDETLYKELSRLIIKCPSMWEEPKNWNSAKDEYLKNTGYYGLVAKQGFAPYDGGIYDGYVPSNGHFNEDYSKVHPTYQYYYHEGVDFAANRKKPIHSFIYGSVIDFGKHSTMGGYMIVAYLFESDKFYLLLHILDKSWEDFGIKKGTIVYPGMTVAKVWTQLTNEAFHLHVSVIQLKAGEIPIPDSTGKTPVIRNAAIKFPVWMDTYKERMRNPFKHDETWGGRK